MYIYINFSDLRDETRDEILSIANERAREAHSKEEDQTDLEYSDFISEKADQELINMSHEGLFVFSI